MAFGAILPDATMFNQISFFAQANIGEGLFYAYLFLILVWLMLALAIIGVVSLWIARRARQRMGERVLRRALLGGMIGGSIASGLAALGTFPLANLAGGWLWIAGSLLLACGLGACSGASLGVNPNMKTLGATALFALSLLSVYPIAQTVLSKTYRRPPFDEAIQRIEAGDVTVLRHLSTYPQQKSVILTALLDSLDRFPKEQRRDAILMLGEIGAGDKRVKTKLWSLIDQQEGVRPQSDLTAAIEALGKQGTMAESSVPKLLVVLRESSLPEVRRSSLNALLKIAPESPQLIPAFLHAAEDSNAQVRHEAFTSLRQLQPAPESVVPQLAKIYGQADTTDRHWMGELLRDVDPTGELIMPAIKAEWESYSDEARRSAQSLLDRFPQMNKKQPKQE